MFHFIRSPVVGGLLALIGAVVVAATPNPKEAQFMAENQAAMTRMMRDMSVTATGNIDRDFVTMMIPHHQGAIDMAQTELRYGRNEQLRRIAQEIIVDQMQEIVSMRVAIDAKLPPSVASPTDPSPANLYLRPQPRMKL